MSNEPEKKVYTPEFRVSHPAVYVRNTLSGKYQVDALFPEGTDLSEMKRIASEAAAKRWGKNIPEDLKSPFLTHKEGPEYEGIATVVILKSQKRKPGVIAQDGDTFITEESGDFYGGCWAHARIKAYAYGGPGTSYAPGVSIGLQSLQKIRDDEPFGGGGGSANNDYEALEGGSEDQSAYGKEDSDIFG